MSDFLDPTKASAQIDIFDNIEPFAGKYRYWICDIWGVIHNGVDVFAHAVEACQQFRQGGGVIVFLTNAPRPDFAIQEQLDQLGVPRDCFDALVTSGDVTRSLLISRPNLAFHHIGPERDHTIFTGLDTTLVSAQDAQAVICSGLYDDQVETPEDYREQLQSLRERSEHGVEMICANPDIVVERGKQIIYCAGALAELYEEMGGKVIYAGKPHLPIYDLAIEKIKQISAGPVQKADILAIGDGVKTDMRGAASAELAALYIASAVHLKSEPAGAHALFSQQVEDLFANEPQKPLAAQREFKW